eukprot:scaffold126090_cov75-Phaeocystis_antarctica.AAC.1
MASCRIAGVRHALSLNSPTLKQPFENKACPGGQLPCKTSLNEPVFAWFCRASCVPSPPPSKRPVIESEFSFDWVVVADCNRNVTLTVTRKPTAKTAHRWTSTRSLTTPGGKCSSHQRREECCSPLIVTHPSSVASHILLKWTGMRARTMSTIGG